MYSELLRLAADSAKRYLQELPLRKVACSPAAVKQLNDQLDRSLPQNPMDPREVIKLLDEVVAPATMANAGGRFFGFVVGGALPTALAADWLTSTWDQNTCLTALSPAGACLERITSRWLIDLLGLPVECHTSFVTGTAMANVTGLIAARSAVLKKAGWDVDAHGLFGAPPVNVVVSDEAHGTLYRALSILGLGKARVFKVPCDNQGRMRADALPPLTEPSIVCTQAGNVNTGAFDPAEEICTAAHRSGAWVHVDGAFGLWAAAAPEHAHLTRGFEKADSWATDGHKWLNIPYDCGFCFIRDATHLRRALSVKAAYLVHDESGDPWDFTPESSRRARVFPVWAALLSLGRSGVADLIERTCSYATLLAEGLRDAGYEILNEVVINQVLVSFGNTEKTQRIIQAVQEEGTCWCGGTTWQGKAAMRISVSSWATTRDDIARSLEAILNIAKKG
ncbi:MAG: aminotransferase class V-fold PLP-dependent enzyme [Planctomycetota bacterium]